MPSHTIRQTLLAAIIVFGLIIIQSGAFILQFREGFIPRKTVPVRVAFSWDMFATRIERCNATFTPPLAGLDPPLESLAKRSAPFEWMAICEPYEGCIAASKWACGFAQSPTLVQIECYIPEGHKVVNEFECPHT